MKTSPFKLSRNSWISLAGVTLFIIACLMSIASGVRADGKNDAAIPPKIGDAAPDFSLPYATQEKIYLKPEERMTLAPDLQLYTWGLRFLRECTAERARRNTLVKLRLCQYSQTVMKNPHFAKMAARKPLS